MDIEQIERFVQNRPDMAQAMYHDIIPLSAFVSFAAAIRRAALEEAAKVCEEHAFHGRLMTAAVDPETNRPAYNTGALETAARCAEACADSCRALAAKEPSAP